MVTETDKQPFAQIHKIYLRQVSLETALSAALLKEPLTPDIKLELRIQTHPLGNDQEEVILDTSITVRETHNLLYWLKLQQAGCFVLKNVPDTQKAFFLNTACPQLLFPYVSQMANTLIVQAGFSSLNLMPIDFVQLYQQQLTQKSDQISSKSLEAEAQQPGTKNKWTVLNKTLN